LRAATTPELRQHLIEETLSIIDVKKQIGKNRIECNVTGVLGSSRCHAGCDSSGTLGSFACNTAHYFYPALGSGASDENRYGRVLGALEHRSAWNRLH
jgi:hypothetical protein